MLLIVLLKDKPEPLDLVESDAVAALVVNSLKNRQHNYLMFTGNRDNLAMLAKSITTHHYSGEPKVEILKLAERAGCPPKSFGIEASSQEILSNLLFEGLSDIEAGKLLSYVLENNTELTVGSYAFSCSNNKFFHNCVVTASLPETLEKKNVWDGPARSPGKTSYPSGMNPTDFNKRCWQYVVKRHGGRIRQAFAENFGQQWIATMIIYQRVCLAMKVRPWKVDLSKPMDSTQAVRDKLVMEDEKADVIIDQVFGELLDNKLVLRLEDLRFWNIEKGANYLKIVFSKKLTLPSSTSASQLIDFLKLHYGWVRTKGRASLEVSTLTDLHLVDDDSGCRFVIEFSLPLNSAKALVGDMTGDLATAVKKLMLIWMETGRLRFRKKDLAA